jgi:hypothetical protein
MLDFSGYNVPAHTQQALADYIENGVPVGGFLNAVLANDLIGAVGSADAQNIKALKDIVGWVCACAPQGSYGSEALYRRWLHEHPTRSKGPLEVV